VRQGLRSWWALLARHCQQLAAPLLIAVLGTPGVRRSDRLISMMASQACRTRAVSSALANLPPAGLALLAKDPIARTLLLGKPADAFPLRDLLARVDSPELRAVAADAIERYKDTRRRDEFIYQAICLSGAEISRDQRCTALMVVAQRANQLSESHARQILIQCLILGRQPLNPYDVPDLLILGRRAATAILEDHPALDDLVYERLAIGAWSTELQILAAALVRRPLGRPAAIAALFERWRPTPALALRFAAEADLTRAFADRPRARTIRDSHWKVALRRGSAAAGKRFAVPVAVGAAIILSWRYRWPAPPLVPAFAEGLAALAVIAAIHVVSAQLAATRLDGVLARYSTSSVPLVASYWAAIVLTACTFPHGNRRLDRAIGWGSTVAAAIFVVGAVAAAWALVRQTDPASAAKSFADNRADFYRKTGNRQGKLQARSLSFRDGVTQLGYLALATELIQMERRTPIRAGRRGVLIPSLRQLRRLRSRSIWADGHIRLQVLGRVGTVVSAGTEIAAVLPDATTNVPAGELRQVTKAFHLHSVKRIERAAEGVVVLAAVTGRLARAGDRGGAERTGEALQELLAIHLAAARRVRRANIDADRMAPVIPALKDALYALCSLLADSKSETEREILEDLVKRTVLVSSKADAATSIVSGRLRLLDDTLSAVEIGSILRVLGRACLETDDRNSLRQVERETRKRFVHDGETVNQFIEVAADIAAMAAWLDQPLASETWRGFWNNTAPPVAVGFRVAGAWRIGVANLAAGSVSVAIDVLLRLRSNGIDLAKLSSKTNDSEYTAREAFMSELEGGYLGQAPVDAIGQFSEFARSIADSIA
jgi:hypothetical protein